MMKNNWVFVSPSLDWWSIIWFIICQSICIFLFPIWMTRPRWKKSEKLTICALCLFIIIKIKLSNDDIISDGASINMRDRWWWWWEGSNEHDCRADQQWWSLHRHDNRWLMSITSQTALLRYLQSDHPDHQLRNATHSFSSSPPPPNHIIIIIHSLINHPITPFIHSFIHSLMMMIMMKWEITN